jgi:hypothetical protein
MVDKLNALTALCATLGARGCSVVVREKGKAPGGLRKGKSWAWFLMRPKSRPKDRGAVCGDHPTWA